MIEQVDTFVFVISPAGVSSRFCEQEVEYATELKRRIVPVLRVAVANPDLPAAIRDHNWIPFTDTDPFDTSLQRLFAAIDRDPEYVYKHTR